MGQSNKPRITAALNLYHELRGSDYRHNIPDDPYLYKRIRNRDNDLFWDGHCWHTNGKIYFSRDSVRRAFRNTNGYLHRIDRTLLEIVEYNPEVNARIDVCEVFP